MGKEKPVDPELDLRGYQCPLPVLKTRHHMRKLGQGQRIWVLTDDPLAVIDIPNFCNEHKQRLVEQAPAEEKSHRFLIERQGKL